MFALVVLLSALVAYSAGECESEAPKFYECLKAARKPPQENGPPPHKEGGPGGEWKEMAEKRTKCFTDNKCKVPERKDDDHKQNPKEDKMGQCVMQVFTDIKSCMSKKGNQFPPPPQFNESHHGPEKEDDGHGHGPDQGDHDDHHFGGGKADLKDCPAADKVNVCLVALRPKGGPEKQGGQRPTKEEREKRFNERCNAEKACFNQMTKPCQALFEKSKKDLCACGADEKSKFQTCVGSDPNATRVADGIQKGICEDKCSKPFQDDDEHRLRRRR